MSATRTISTKLKIEGESEYKSALSNINTELGNMKSRLSETTSEYQSNQNSIEALQSKVEALTNVQQSQADKVNVLKEAYNTASSTLSEYRDKGDQLSTSIQTNEEKLSSMSTEVQEAGQQWADYSTKISENEERLRELESSTGDTSEEEAQLREEITQCQNAMEQLETETDGAAKEAGELILQDQQLNTELDQNNQKTQAAENACNNWERQLNNAQTQLNNTDNELKETNQYLEEAEKSSDGCATSIDQFGNKMDSSAKSADTLSGAIGAAGLVAATKKLIDAMESCIKTAAAFESQMSTVKALSGATSDDMDLLTQAAKEMGATTSFTATESAEALEYMALAGWDTEEMLDGLPGIINLAAAAGEDLGSTCDIVTDALTAFGLSASDSAHFSDVLATTATSSNTTVAQMGEAFKQVATTAGTLGYSIDDVSVALGLMADNGLKGSSAGTALSTALTRMSGANSSARKEMDELNVSMYNADGTTKDLSQFLGELRTSLNENCTSSQDMQIALYNLAGQKGMKGLAAIVNTTDEDFDALTQAIAECDGSAEEMANIRLDNFSGQVTLLKSAWDALVTTLGEAALGALTNITEVFTDIISSIGNFLSQHEILTKAIDAFVVALAAAGVALGVVSVAVSELSKKITGLFAAIAASPFGPLAIALSALVAGFTAFILMMQDCESEEDKLRKSIATTTQDIKDQKKAQEEAAAETEQTATSYRNLAKELEDLLNNTDNDAASQARLMEVIKELNEYLGEGTIIYDEQTDSINLTTDAVYDLVEGMIDESELEAAMADQTSWSDKKKEAYEALQEAQAAYDAGLDKLHEDEDRYKDDELALAQATQEDYAQLSLLSDQLDEAQSNFDAICDEIDRTNDTINELSESEEELTAKEIAVISSVEDLGETLVALQDAYDEAYESAYESISGQFDLWEQLDEVTTTSFEDAHAAMQSQISYWQDYTDNLDYLMGLNIDGLDELVAAYSDGSTESAGYIASMAGMTHYQLLAIVADYHHLTNTQYDAAAASADASTQFSASVEEAINECIETLWGLDLSEEEYQLAYDTLANYVLGLTDEEGELTGEVETVKQEILDEFGDAEIASQMERNAQEQAKSYEEGLTYTLEEAEGPISEIVRAGVEGIGSDDNVAIAKDSGSALASGVEEGIESEQDGIAESFETAGNNALIKADWDTPAKEAGASAMDSVAEGASGEESNVTDTFGEIGENADSSLRESVNEENGKDAGSDYIEGVVDGAEEATEGKLKTWFKNAGSTIGGWFKNLFNPNDAEEGGEEYIQGAEEGIEAQEGPLVQTTQSVAIAATNAYEGECNKNTLQPAGSDLILGAITGENSQSGNLNSTSQSIGSGAANALKNGMPASSGKSTGADFIGGSVTGVSSRSGDLSNAAGSAGRGAQSSLANGMTYSSGYSTGSNFMQGGIDAVNAKAGALASAASSAASSASSRFQNTLQVASPSKLSRWILENYMEGGIIGIEDKEADLSDSMAEAAKRASASFSENMAMDTEELNTSATMAYSASVNATSTGMEQIAAALENLSKMDLSVLEYLPYLQDIANNTPDIYLNGKSIVEYVRKQISNDQHTIGRAAGIV